MEGYKVSCPSQKPRDWFLSRLLNDCWAWSCHWICLGSCQVKSGPEVKDRWQEDCKPDRVRWEGDGWCLKVQTEPVFFLAGCLLPWRRLLTRTPHAVISWSVTWTKQAGPDSKSYSHPPPTKKYKHYVTQGVPRVGVVMKADVSSNIFSQTCVYSSKSICVNKLSLLLHLKTFSRKLCKTNPSFFDFSSLVCKHTIKSEKVWHKVVILVDELCAIHAVSNKQFEASPSPPPVLIHCLPPRRNIRLKVVTVSWKEYFWEGFTFEHHPHITSPMSEGGEYKNSHMSWQYSRDFKYNKFTKVQLNAHKLTQFSKFLMLSWAAALTCQSQFAPDPAPSPSPGRGQELGRCDPFLASQTCCCQFWRNISKLLWSRKSRTLDTLIWWHSHKISKPFVNSKHPRLFRNGLRPSHRVFHPVKRPGVGIWPWPIPCLSNVLLQVLKK